MFLGFTQFKCSECGNKFEGIAAEYEATAFVAPVKCPHCGSMHTLPFGIGILPYLKDIYKTIWESIDKQNEGL